MTPEELQNLEPAKKQEVDKIIQELNKTFNTNIITESNLTWPNT
jgi:hypothetical protein